MTTEKTPEEIAKSVSAAFDSVDLIEALNAKGSLTEMEEATKARNVGHLQIMMGYDWFVEALTPEQEEQIFELI